MCRDYLSNRAEEEQCALVVLDLDNFKHINDSLGHQHGDKLLHLVGQTLTEVFSCTNNIIGRIGGDEFLVLIKDNPDAQMLTDKSEEIRLKIQQAFNQYPSVHSSCCMGIAISQKQFVAYEELFILADQALYEAKNAGKSSQRILEYRE